MRRDVENILVDRDGVTQAEAKATVDSCLNEIDEALASGDIDLIGDILMNDLGLEEDYIFDLL